MHRYWFAVRCGNLIGAFQAPDAHAAACMAMLQWAAERDGRLSETLSGPVTVVVPAGGRVPEDCFRILTVELLHSLELPLQHETRIRPEFGMADVMPH
jgi:hypothetical protein